MLRLSVVALLVLVLVGGVPVPVDAQSPDDRPVSLGVIGGMSITSLSSPDTSVNSPWPPDRSLNFIGGAFALLRVAQNIAFQPGVMYSGKGAKGTVFDDGTPITLVDRLHYLTLPILARLSFNSMRDGMLTPYVVAGPEVGFKLRATQTVDVGFFGLDSSSQTINSAVKTTEYAFSVGGGVQFRQALIEVRYTHGLSNIAAAAALPEAKTRTISILFGGRF